QKSQVHATAETGRSQLERDLASERALRAASASDAERALRVEREQVLARHQGELAILRQELASVQQKATDAARSEREQLVAAHAAALATQQKDAGAAQAAAVAGLRTELETEHGDALSQLR